MAIIYYPKGSFLYQRDTLSGSYEQIAVSVSPNTILYFDTSSNLNVLSASTFYLTTSNAIYADTASVVESASYAASATIADVALIADQALTASIAETASLAESASWAPPTPSVSASYATSASLAESSSYAPTSSFLYGNGVVSQSLLFSTMSNPTWRQEGQVFWDYNAHTLAIIPDITSSTLQIGQEQWLRAIAGENIPDGSPVYVSAASSSFPVVNLAISDGVSGKYAVVGVSTGYIESGSVGIITTLGQIHDLDLSAFSDGDSLWLSSTQSGSYTNFPPNDPYQKVLLGYVLNNASGSSVMQVDITALPQASNPFVGITSVPTISASHMTPTGSIINIGTGSVNLCVTANGTGKVKNYQLNSASFALTASFLDAQYIVATYNSGNPIYQMVTDRSIVDSVQTTLVYTLTMGAGGNISYTGWDNPGLLLANKLYSRTQETVGPARSNGLNLAMSGSSLYFTISSGSVWVGVNEISYPAINSRTDRVVLVAHSASVWSGSFVTSASNYMCDNGTNVVPVGGGSNQWVANYIYRGLGSQNSTIVMYSPSYTTLLLAQQSQPPTPPTEMGEFTILVGRIIVKKAGTTADQVDSAFIQHFTPSVPSHNDLSGLDGGIPGEYYHISAGQYARLTAYRTVTGSYTVGVLDSVVYANATSGTLVLTLPTVGAVGGQLFRIKKIDSSGNNVVISSSVNIDYETELRLTQRGSAVTLHSDTTQYWIH